MALPVLASSGYVRPGAYLGRLTLPKPSGAAGQTRQPCYVGLGSRLKYQQNVRFVRSYVQDETVSFSGITYIATLQNPANGDKSKARLYKSSGVPVSITDWEFVTYSSGWTQVKINPQVFDPNATYKMDYQSVSRSVQDPIPFSDLREMLTVGDSQSQRKYLEGIDYFIDFTLTGPTAATGNANKNPSVTAITADGGNTGTGTVAFAAGNAPTYLYNRAYLLEVTAAAGGAGVHTATIRVTAVGLGGGNSSVPDQTVANQGDFSISLIEATPATLTNVSLGHGLLVDFGFGGTNFVIGDKFTFDLLGGARLEFDGTLLNTNQFASVGTPAAGSYDEPAPSANTGTGVITVGDGDYTGEDNRRYEFEVTAAAGVSPNRTATLRWRAYGEGAATTGTVSLLEATPASLTGAAVELGIKLNFSFGATHFVVGDHYKFEAKAPRTLYTGKDTRGIDFTVGAVVDGSPGPATVTISWVTDQPIEGGYGTSGAVQQDVNFDVRNNLLVKARNLVKTNTATAYYVVGNQFSADAASDAVIDWSLRSRQTEAVASTEILFDGTGTVTGTAGLYYLVLSVPPDEIVSVRETLTGNTLVYSTVAGTPYITFASDPGVGVTVRYEYRSNEPDPGNSYYVTATQLRPVADYDKPVQILSKDDANTKLGPMEPTNHVLIACLLGFENGTPSCWAVQGRDRTNSGSLQTYDFAQAIEGSEAKSDISDLVVLSGWSSRGTAKNSVIAMNDPFKRKPRMGWFGAPIDTPIGDQDTSNTLVYTAKQELQVFGNSPAHGKFVLLGNTWCKVTVLLPDGSLQQLTLDGSFVAAGMAGLVASFASPGETPLYKDLSGYDDMQNYDENEQLLLGAAGITSAEVIGASFRLIESLTTDPSSDYSEISWITQDEAVVRTVNADVAAVIGYVPPTAAEGADAIGNTIMLSLARQVSRGTIAPYQTDDGVSRKISRSTDIVVERDPVDRTKYNYLFTYFRLNPIKRVFGLYVSDVSDVTTLLSNG